MSNAKASKPVQAVVDRVVNKIVVAVIRHPDAAEDEPDVFKEINIPGSRFKVLPREGDIIPIDPEKSDVITVNIGYTIYCQVLFMISFANAVDEATFKYQEKHTMSGLYNDPADINAILKARRKFWEECNKDKARLEKKNPDKIVYFSKSSYWTDKYPDKEIFSAFVRQIAFSGNHNNVMFESIKFGSDRIPNKF